MSTMITGICMLFVLALMMAGVGWLFEHAPILGFVGIIIVGGCVVAAITTIGNRKP